jgi:hypothetical protein
MWMESIYQIFSLERKKTEKLRMILNIKKLNEFVDHDHFKMNTLKTALQLAEKDDWFISIVIFKRLLQYSGS